MPAADAAGEQAVAGILCEIHRVWLAEVRQWVGPAMDAEADFWDGWSAVRYLNDQFDRLYRRKQTFLKAVLRRFKPPDLLAVREKTGHLVRGVLELNALGRQQGQGRAVATASARLLELLEGWFAETRRLALVTALTLCGAAQAQERALASPRQNTRGGASTACTALGPHSRRS